MHPASHPVSRVPETVPVELQELGRLPAPDFERVQLLLDTAHKNTKPHSEHSLSRPRLAARTYRALYETATKSDTDIASMSLDHIDDLTDPDAKGGAVDTIRRAICIRRLAALTILEPDVRSILNNGERKNRHDTGHAVPAPEDPILPYYATLWRVMQTLDITNSDVQKAIAVRRARKSADTQRITIRHHSHRPTRH